MMMKRIPITAYIICAVIFYSCQQTFIPLTTNSEEARSLFLQGQDLMDKLRVAESVEYFEKAIQADTNFAMAYLNLAFSANSAVERIILNRPSQKQIWFRKVSDC